MFTKMSSRELKTGQLGGMVLPSKNPMSSFLNLSRKGLETPRRPSRKVSDIIGNQSENRGRGGERRKLPLKAEESDPRITLSRS